MPNSCVIKDCITKGKLHNFPHPSTDPIRYDIWVQAAGLSELEPTVVRKKMICGIHFEAKYRRYPSRRLFVNAVPTLHLPGPIEEARKYDARFPMSVPPQLPKDFRPHQTTARQKYSLTTAKPRDGQTTAKSIIFVDHSYAKMIHIIKVKDNPEPIRRSKRKLVTATDTEKSADSSQERSVANLPPSPTSNNYSDDDSDDDPDYPDPKRKRSTATDTGPGQTAEAVDWNLEKMFITSDISKPQYFSAKETKSRVPKMSVGMQTGVNDILQSAINKAISTTKQYEEQQETSGNHVSSHEPPIFHKFHDQDEIMSELMEHKKKQEIVEEKIVSSIEPIAFKFPNTDEYYMHDPRDEREEQDSNMPTFYKVEVLDSPSVSEDSCDDMEDQEIDEQDIEEGEIEAKDEEIHKFAGFVFSGLKSLKLKKTVNYVIDLVTNIIMKAHLGEYDGVRPSNETKIDGTEYA